MSVHLSECDGGEGPRDRFTPGDRVTHSDLGEMRLKNRYNERLFPRTGVVVGFGTDRSHSSHCVRVQWDGNETASKYAHYFIEHDDGVEEER